MVVFIRDYCFWSNQCDDANNVQWISVNKEYFCISGIPYIHNIRNSNYSGINPEDRLQKKYFRTS